MVEAGNSGALSERVNRERIRLFFGLAKGNMAGILLGTVLISVVLHQGGASTVALSIWCGLIAISSLAVVGFERYVRAIDITEDNCTQFLHIRIGLGACVACLWGVSGYLLPGTDTRVHDTFLFIILSTLVTVGTLGYAAMPAYYLIIDAVSLVPLSAKFAYQLLALGDNYSLLLVVMAVAWQIVVMKKAMQVSGTVIEAIAVNERLKDEIEEHKQTKAMLERMAQQDPLTGLANRSLFSDRLKQTLALSQRNNLRWLFMRSGVLRQENRKQGVQGCLAASSDVVQALKEGQVEGKFFLGNPPVWAQPGAQQRPKTLHRVDVNLMKPVTVLIACVFARPVVDAFVCIAPLL